MAALIQLAVALEEGNHVLKHLVPFVLECERVKETIVPLELLAIGGSGRLIEELECAGSIVYDVLGTKANPEGCGELGDAAEGVVLKGTRWRAAGGSSCPRVAGAARCPGLHPRRVQETRAGLD